MILVQFQSPHPLEDGHLVITPTQTLTQTVALWVAADGTDIGSYAVTLGRGLEVIMVLAVMSLGLWLALRVLP